MKPRIGIRQLSDVATPMGNSCKAVAIGIAAFVGLAWAITAFAQQPQTSSPVDGTNASYLQGVGTGYRPTAGTGLTLNLSAGTSFCNATLVNYAGGTLTMAANATNYVFLNPAAACAPRSNTTGFLIGHIPVATVATDAGSITSITDGRNWFTPLPCTMNSVGAITCSALGANRNITLTPSGTGATVMNRTAQVLNSGAPVPQTTDKTASGIQLPIRPVLSSISGSLTQAEPIGQSFAGVYSRVESKSGGTFTPGPKTGYNPFLARSENHGPASVTMYSGSAFNYGIGDAAYIGGELLITGASPTAGGAVFSEVTVGQNPLTFTATVAGSPAPGATLISYTGGNSATRDYSLGIGRVLINLSHTKTGGQITAFSGFGYDGENAFPGTVTGTVGGPNATSFASSDVGRYFKINADDQTIDGETVGAQYKITAVDIANQILTIEAGFGGNRTVPTTGYTIADGAEILAVDTVTKTITIVSNSYTWVTGDNLQVPVSVHGAITAGSVGVGRLLPNSTRRLWGYRVVCYGNADCESAYTMSRAFPRKFVKGFDATGSVVDIAVDANGALVSAMDVSLDSPIRFGGGDQYGQWSMRAGTPTDAGGFFQFHLRYAGVDVFRTDVNGHIEFARTGCRVVSGAGSPEGVVTAPVCSLYLRTDGVAGSVFYVKEMGSGNTGWAAK